MTKTRLEFLTDVYHEYHDELVRFLIGTVPGGAEEAQDIAQTIFARLAELPEPQKVENIRGYLYRAAKNLVVDQARRKRVRDKYQIEAAGKHGFDNNDQHSPERILLDREQLRTLERVVVGLPPKRRRIFLLNRIHNLTYAQIGKEMGVSEESVRKHMKRALNACAKALARAGHGPVLTERAKP